jgi:hypothetical protein
MGKMKPALLATEKNIPQKYIYPKNDLNVYDFLSEKLKFSLSTIPALGF